MARATRFLQVNIRLLLRDEAARRGGPVTLAEVSEDTLGRWCKQGFQAVWLMGIWKTGAEGKRLSATHPAFTAHHKEALPDWTEADVFGSPYAVQDYAVHPDFGGDAALQVLRGQLAAAGMKLILDFVPNHTARDHPWAASRPDLYVSGSESNFAHDPEAFMREGDRILACGRDPYFPPWLDTLQLDYRKAETRRTLIDTLRDIAGKCDGVRCDMAMLVLRDIFLKTWGGRWDDEHEDFWAAAIDAVRAEHPKFLFIAEVYWDMERRLNLLGFDLTYDKVFYDRLVARDIPGVQERLGWAIADQRQFLRFLENHDEARLAAAIPDRGYRRAAMALMALAPGSWLVHDGQERALTWRESVHLGRRYEEADDAGEADFYARLLSAVARAPIDGGDCRIVWPNEAEAEVRGVVAVLWEGPEGDRCLGVVNLSPDSGVAHVPVPFCSVAGRRWRLVDRLTGSEYPCHGDVLATSGLPLPVEPYQVNILDCVPE